jgi:hypothetical protein
MKRAKLPDMRTAYERNKLAHEERMRRVGYWTGLVLTEEQKQFIRDQWDNCERRVLLKNERQGHLNHDRANDG